MTSTHDTLEDMSYLCVSVVKARDLPTMGITGALDLYVEVKLGDLKGVTRHVEKNANPVWRQMFTFSEAQLQSNQLQIIVKHKDDFVGRVDFDVSDIPRRLSPYSRLAPQWYHLSDSLGEILLAVWLGTQADEAFLETRHSDAHALSLEGITNTRSKVYYSPKLIYLRVAVMVAQDLMGTKKDKPLAPTVAKIQMGSQIMRTRPGQPQGSANPAWNEDFMFVVSEPFEDPLAVTVEEMVGHGRYEPIGRVIIPVVSPYVECNDLLVPVSSKWFSLSRGMTGSKILLRMSLDTAYHVLDERAQFVSDLHPAAAF